MTMMFGKRDPTVNWDEEYYFIVVIGDKLPTDDSTIRKKFVIRSFVASEVVLDRENDYEAIKNFHRLSGGATIGISSEKAGRKHGFQNLELVGAVHQVETAEKLIRNAIEKIDKRPYVPPPLMPPSLHCSRIPLPEDTIYVLMGNQLINFTILEAQTGTWLKVDMDYKKSVLNGILIYGTPLSQVNNAYDLLTRIVSKLEPVTEERVWDILYEEIPDLKENDPREAEKQQPSKKQRTMNLGVGNETQVCNEVAVMECGVET